MATNHGLHAKLYVIECQKTAASPVVFYIATGARQTGHAADAILLGGRRPVGTVFNELKLAEDHVKRINKPNSPYNFKKIKIRRLGHNSKLSIDPWRYNWHIGDGSMLTMCIKQKKTCA